MANVAYIRVSTVEQNEDRQLENLKQYQIDRIFSEKVSAKDTKRPQLQEMLRYVREGDTVEFLTAAAARACSASGCHCLTPSFPRCFVCPSESERTYTAVLRTTIFEKI